MVDPRFREQFTVGVHSARYSAALSILEEFVGGAARLTALVEFLCGGMATAFAAVGMVLPPWWHHRAMISKWLPSRARTVQVLPAPGFSRGSATPCSVLLRQTPALASHALPLTPTQRLPMPPSSALQRGPYPAVAASLVPSMAREQHLQQPKQVIGGFTLPFGSASRSGLLSRGLKALPSPSVEAVPAPFENWRRLSSAAVEEPLVRIHTVKLRGGAGVHHQGGMAAGC